MAFHTLRISWCSACSPRARQRRGTTPLFVLSAPGDVLVSDVGLGNWEDMVGVVIGLGIFLGIVAYFWNRDKMGQMDGPASKIAN